MRKFFITAVLAAAIFLAALLSLDFHLGFSSTSQNITVTRISGGNGSAEHPNPLSPQTSPLGIYTQDPKLGEYLVRQLKEQPGFEEIEILTELPQNTTQPVLIVNQPKTESLWLAFFAKSAVSVNMLFATDGQWNGDHIDMRDGQPPVVHLKVEMNLADRSAGLISRPWYLRHIREEIGKQVILSLQNDLLQPASATLES